MRGYRRLFLPIILATAAVGAMTIAPTAGQAQGKARVAIQSIVMATPQKSQWMEAEEARSIAKAIAVSSVMSGEMISCWTEPKSRWFDPLRFRFRQTRTYSVRVRSTETEDEPARPQKPKY